MARRMLGKLGYTVLAASTPGEAIRLAGEHAGEIHLLMTDVVMPEMNGRDLAERLHAIYPDLKRLFMSGYTADVIAHHGVLDEGRALHPEAVLHEGPGRQGAGGAERKVSEAAVKRGRCAGNPIALKLHTFAGTLLWSGRNPFVFCPLPTFFSVCRLQLVWRVCCDGFREFPPRATGCRRSAEALRR